MSEGLVREKRCVNNVQCIKGLTSGDCPSLTHCQPLLVQPQLAECEARMGQQAATSSMDKDNKVSTQHFKVHESVLTEVILPPDSQWDRQVP